MFERFTDRARSVVVLAQEEARQLNHDYIGTEHLLLGLLSEREGLAAKVLQSTTSVTIDRARKTVRDIVGCGSAQATGHMPFTPRARKVLELSLRQAYQLGHNYIGTEHLLLGLIAVEDTPGLGNGAAIRVLLALDADLDKLRKVTLDMIGAQGRDRSVLEPRQIIIDTGVPDELLALRRQNGENSPEFKGALADFLEEHVKRLRSGIA